MPSPAGFLNCGTTAGEPCPLAAPKTLAMADARARVPLEVSYGACAAGAVPVNRHGINSAIRLMGWPSAILVRISLR